MISGLQSFCIYASIGLACIFFLQISWLLAWLVLDERRIRNNQNGLLPCIVHQITSNVENKNTNAESEINTSKNVKLMKLNCIFFQFKQKVSSYGINEVMRKSAEFCISSIIYCAIIITISCGLLGVGIYGLTQINYKFDPLVLVPSNSYFTRFLEVNDQYFSPLRGYKANIYFESINSSHLESIDWLDNKLATLVENNEVLESYNSWWKDFTQYVDEEQGGLHMWKNLTNETFPLVFSDFLFSNSGSKHQKFFEFDTELRCGIKAPKILVN